jgi:hypothetical protein
MVNNISQNGPIKIGAFKELPNNHIQLMEYQRYTGNVTYSKMDLYDFMK